MSCCGEFCIGLAIPEVCVFCYKQFEQINNVTNIFPSTEISREPVSIMSGYGLDDRAIEVQSPAEAKRFLL
jgi:hypothetical protein